MFRQFTTKLAYVAESAAPALAVDLNNNDDNDRKPCARRDCAC